VTMLHMLDTDTASYVIKRRPPAIAEQLARVPPSSVCVSAITRAELQYGLKRLPDGHRLHLGVRRFLAVIRVLPWDAEAADIYADIRHRLETTGQLIGELDMMIAAHSLAARAVLVTNNARHFDRLPDLAVVNWCDQG
jgi:tRNA(fMet)-specific endonuclease VapC